MQLKQYVTRALWVCSCLLFEQTYCRPQYQSRIPNGGSMMNPCDTSASWPGVGHIAIGGAGPRNQFGIDFAAAGYKWTKELCTKDSDGDGKTNGQELGDPNCVFQEGSNPDRTTGITHPGFCEPVSSAECVAKNDKVYGAGFCSKQKFHCPIATDNSTGNVVTFDVKRVNTVVPDLETAYMCQAFAIPKDKLQLVAMEAIIDNTDVMHHMLLYSCDKKPRDSQFKPYLCSMGNGCWNLISLWTVGIPGECFHKDLGVTTGEQAGLEYVMLETHFNNPMKRKDFMDSSGMKLIFTKKPRLNDAGVLMILQRYLEIPANTVSLNQTMTASSECLEERMNEVGTSSIKLTTASVHMHYNGKNGGLVRIKKGSSREKENLLKYQGYSYENPGIVLFNEPKVIEKGDSIHLTCNFRNKMSNSIFWGESTGDEMCIGFFRYYPKLRRSMVVWYGDIDVCKLSYTKYGGFYGQINKIGSCYMLTFIYATIGGNTKRDLETHCGYSEPGVCHPSCKTVVAKLMKDPCMQGWPRKYLDFMAAYSNPIKVLRLQIGACEAELLGRSIGNIPKRIENDPMEENLASPIIPPQGNNSEMVIIIAVACACGALCVLAIVGVIAYCVKYRASVSKSSKSSSAKKLHLDDANSAGGSSSTYDNSVYQKEEFTSSPSV